jgi:membrane protease YdiL (CAAX protease family)
VSRRIPLVAFVVVATDAALIHFWSGSTELLYGFRLLLGVGALATLVRMGASRETLGITFTADRSDFRRIGICSLAVLFLYAGLMGLHHLFPTSLGIDFVDEEGAWRYGWTLLLLAPVAEEILYRGVVVPALRESLPTWAVVVSSGLLFYLLHLSYGKDWRLLHYVPAGMILAWAFLSTRKLWVPILLHFLGNVLMGIDDIVRLLGE